VSGGGGGDGGEELKFENQLTCDEFCHMTAPANFGLEEISKNRSSFFPILTGVKFTAIKVIIYASIFYCKKLPFVVEKYFLLLQV